MKRMTIPAAKVLSALMQQQGLSGAAITKTTGVTPGTLYPLLVRLEQSGWIAGEWEVGDPVKLGRPRRRFYSITAEGVRGAREAAAPNAALYGRLASC